MKPLAMLLLSFTVVACSSDPENPANNGVSNDMSITDTSKMDAGMDTSEDSTRADMEPDLPPQLPEFGLMYELGGGEKLLQDGVVSVGDTVLASVRVNGEMATTLGVPEAGVLFTLTREGRYISHQSIAPKGQLAHMGHSANGALIVAATTDTNGATFFADSPLSATIPGDGFFSMVMSIVDGEAEWKTIANGFAFEASAAHRDKTYLTGWIAQSEPSGGIGDFVRADDPRKRTTSVIEIDNDGNAKELFTIPGTAESRISDIFVDDSGIYLCGNVVNGNNEPEQITIGTTQIDTIFDPNMGYQRQPFLGRLDLDGTPTWAYALGGNLGLCSIGRLGDKIAMLGGIIRNKETTVNFGDTVVDVSDNLNSLFLLELDGTYDSFIGLNNFGVDQLIQKESKLLVVAYNSGEGVGVVDFSTDGTFSWKSAKLSDGSIARDFFSIETDAIGVFGTAEGPITLDPEGEAISRTFGEADFNQKGIVTWRQRLK